MRETFPEWGRRRSRTRTCWESFGLLQADELTHFEYPRAHRVVVDAYMAPHVGLTDDRRQRQSVFVHLVSLCFTLEHHGDDATGRLLISRLLERGTAWEIPASGRMNVLSMTATRDVDDYTERALAWAPAVWASWAEHHLSIREALSKLW